jgi:hypothetical protein
MKTKSVLVAICIITMLFLTSGGSAAPGATPLGTAFTYQGRLDRNGGPYTGSCDFTFSLWDAVSEGSQVGTTVNKNGLMVSAGLFTTRLNFGPDAFNGYGLWLEVTVQCPEDVTPMVFPRQELTAAPYALYALGAPWSGLTGKPAGLDDGDDDTTYSVGDGLVLSSTVFSIDPTYTQRRVSTTCAAGMAIRAISQDGSVTCEVDDNTTYTAGSGLSLSSTTFSIDPVYTQRRVSSSCTAGSYIQAINEDGSVECELDAPLNRPAVPIDNTLSTLDSSGHVGRLSSITIGADGLGLISYLDSTNGFLKTAHCNDIACTSATTATLDSSGDVGYYPSITIGSDGLGLISYSDNTNYDLKTAHCNDIACTSATIAALDTIGDVGKFTSITIGADGLGLISYYDHTNYDLKAAHCNNLACTSATTAMLDSGGTVGMYTSITIGADGLGLISCYDNTNGNLKTAHCNDISCTSAATATLDSSGNVGEFTSITIGTDGLGLISYHDDTNSDLKTAHCSNAFCIPYFRRR